MLFQNFCKFLLPVGSSVHVRNTHIKYGRSATFPESMAAGIPPFLSGGRWTWSVCGPVGVDESGELAPAAFRTRRLTLDNILGLCSTRQGESAVPHKCLHSSATSSCQICTSPPVLNDRACSTVILAPQPSQAAGISSGEWFYRRRTLSLHSSADRPVPFNRFGKTESHVPVAQFHLSPLATAGLSRPRRSRKICSSWSRSL
jgi:hypothetical protein